MRRLFKAGLCLLILVSASILTFYIFQHGPSVQETGTSISDVKRLLGAPAGHVYFLYGENIVRDSVSVKMVFDMFENQQIELYYQLNDPWVDSQGCPRPDVIGSGKYVVLFGGPFSQASVKYYEDTRQAPVVFRLNDTYVWWETMGGEILEETVMARLEFDEHHDIFLIEFFTDSHGRGVFVFYGYGWRGTWAAALYFRKVIYAEISEYTKPYYIFKWVDTNNDGFPSADEVIENRPKYVSVQATLHNNINQSIVKWFANA